MKTIVFLIADTHNGSTTGLMTRSQWQGKSYYDPNPVQRIIRKQLEEGVEEVAGLRKGNRLVVCVVGDAIDGNHHQSVELVTPDPDEQARMHTACMLDILKTLKFGKQDKLYYVEGTEVHTGQKEDAIARDLGAVPYILPTVQNEYKDGRFVFPRLVLNVNGIRLDIAHHGGSVGKRAWTKDSAIRSVLKSIYFDCLNYCQPIPNYWIRANEHRHIHDTYSDQQGGITGIVLPALQLKTRYSHSVSGDSTLSTIGTTYIVVEEDGLSWWKVNKLTFDEQGEREETL